MQVTLSEMDDWEEANAGHVERFHIYLEYDGSLRKVIFRAVGSAIYSMSVHAFWEWFWMISRDTTNEECFVSRKPGKISPCHLQSKTKQYKSDTWIRFVPQKDKQ